jgi:hypothetical protein
MLVSLAALYWAITHQRGLRFVRTLCVARRTGFYHGVGAPTTPTVRDSDPLSWIETFVTFCGVVGLWAMVLVRLT